MIIFNFRGRFGNSSMRILPLVIAASLFAGGCGTAAKNQAMKTSAIDLTDRFVPVHPLPPGKMERHFTVARKGQRKDAMVLVAPAAIIASLKGVSGKMKLEGLATPVFNIGDGIQMDVFLAGAGRRHLLGSRYFDAARRAEDRDWIPIEVPLEPGGQDNLEIRVSAGPQGDLVADWLALSSLRLLQMETGK